MKDVDDICMTLWHIKAGVAALFWEFTVSMLCFYVLPVRDSPIMWWWILTAITVIVWFSVLLIHRGIESKRIDDELRAQMEAEEAAEE